MSIFKSFIKHYLISSALLSSQTNRVLFSISNQIKTMSSPSSSSSAEYSMAYVTAPTAEVAKDIAKKIVSAKLSACVNIIPSITSVYEWKGNIETDSEVLMIIKTRTELIDELTVAVKANHPYEVFELISTPIQNGNPEYLKWLGEVVPKKQT